MATTIKERINRNLKNTILLSWVMSYLVMLVIPIGISTILYKRSINDMRQKTQQVYSSELDKFKFILDEKLEEMNRIALELSFNADVSSLIYQNTITNEEHFQFYQLQKRLMDYCISNGSTQNIALILLDCDAVVSNRSTYTIGEFGSAVLSTPLMEELSEKKFRSDYVVVSENQVGYFLSLPLISNSPNNALIAITAADPIFQEIQSSLGDKCLNLYLGDQVLSLQGNEYQSGQEQKNLVLSLDSKIPSVWYEYRISNQEFISAIKGIQVITLLCCFVCVVICALLGYFFIRKNYRPILEILSKVGFKFNAPAYSYKDEYDYINQSVSRMLKESKQLRMEIDQKQLAMRDLYLMKLLTDELPGEELPLISGDRLFECLSTRSLLVAAVKPVEYEQLFHEPGVKKENFYLLEYIIKNILHDFQENQDVLDMVTLNGNYIVLVKGTVEGLTRFLRQLEKLPLLLKASFNAKICIGVSENCCGIDQLAAFYRQSLEALQYCEIIGKDYLVYGKESANSLSQCTNHQTLFELNKKFKNAVAAADCESARELLDPLFQLYFNPAQAVSEIRLNMYELIYLYRSALMELNQRFPASGFPIDEEISALLNCSNIDLLKLQLSRSLKLIEQKCRQSADQELELLKREIVSYVEQHCNSYNLSVSSIAEHFGMPVSSISRIFKKVMGLGLLDYIHKVKITHAKELLALHKYTVAEVAELVGYNNSSSFIRIYKKYEGISPGKLIR